ncbi:MAG TPA: glycine--tRNA ligase [Thermoplasmatales archaeon]|nr:glycine--tRNA ligase [Thermoplasmatales archaeon]HEX08630.1 glycine--tRNA ligase [Thermoplasmatales archaeon]
MQDIYEKILMLAKRRGILFPSFEIYGGSAGFYDYGPIGSLLKHNIENLWREYYLIKENFLEIETPTITIYDVLKASGHVDEFTDLMLICSKCNRAFKAEEVFPDLSEKEIVEAIKEGKLKCPDCNAKIDKSEPFNLMFSTTIGAGKGRKGFLRPETAQGIFTNFHLLYRYIREKIPFGVIQIGRGYRNEIAPRQGIIRLREFSMAEAEVFFDPKEKSHPKYEEIKRNKIRIVYDDKEEIISIEDAVNRKIIANDALAYYMSLTQDFLIECGIDKQKLRFRKHNPDELAHYANECWDAEIYSERFGWIECVGIADRSAYDLKAHIEASGKDMYAIRRFKDAKEEKILKIVPNMKKIGSKFREKAQKIKQELEKIEPNKIKDKISIEVDGEKIELTREYFDVIESKEKKTIEKFVPHVIEPSYGIDRIIYGILEHNFFETMKKGEKYTILKLNPKIAPIKAGIFPLVNDKRLVDKAKEIEKDLRETHKLVVYYDDSGTIGRRYARMDEIGTPFCITVDHQTIEDDTVTVRDRDTTKQIRLKISDLPKYLKEKIAAL